jgi:membrane associated rhomboid family serine protease
LDQNRLTHFSKEITDKTKIFDAVLVSVFFLVIIWSLFVMDEYLGFHFKQYGLEPRVPSGLRGIFTMHFLHSDFKHIGQNSMGFLVLNTFLFYFYRQIGFQVFLLIFFLSSVILWLVGRDGNHIGASVLIYGEFAFLLISGMIRKNPILMRVALVVVLYYGSLVWYVFPVDMKISWEGHASGFFIGTLAAILLRNKGPKRKPYQFEIEPELPDDENAYWKIPKEQEQPVDDTMPKPSSASTSSSTTSTQSQTTVTVKYHYKP